MAQRIRPTLAVRLVIGLVLSVLAVTAAATETEAVAEVEILTAEQTALNLDSFDMVWSTIHEKHWDPELGGLDWAAVRDTLRPKVAEATSMDEARGYMQQVIAQLKQSHFGIFPADVYRDAAGVTDDEDDDEGDDSRGTGVTGLDVRVADGQALVFRLDPGSSAEEAGVKPGWEIVTADGDSVRPRIAKLEEVFGEQTLFGLIAARAVASRLDGDIGETVDVQFRDGNDEIVDLDLELRRGRGKPVTLGNLPTERVWWEQKRLDGDVGYFGFNLFLGVMEVMSAYNQAMQDFADCRGIIIDLRGNAGGLGGMSMGMSGWFFAEKGHELGVMITRGGELKFAVNPRLGAFTGPVAVLIDDLSASTAEIMAGGLKDLGRARLFGTSTAGAALPSVIDKLPNGDGFQYAIANYISTGGETLEGGGVTPDEVLPLTRDGLLQKGDYVLQAALDWIESGSH